MNTDYEWRRKLFAVFFIVDIGFILYWFLTGFLLLPPEYLYQDYSLPVMVNWNWSFFPLDILVSVTGLGSIYLFRKKNKRWQSVALISLVLTFCSGLQAISFWIFQAYYDPLWWSFNLFLLLYPLPFIAKLVGLSGRKT